MTSILKVGEIQDPTNGNTALEVDSSGVRQGDAMSFSWPLGVKSGHYQTTQYKSNCNDNQ